MSVVAYIGPKERIVVNGHEVEWDQYTFHVQPTAKPRRIGIEYIYKGETFLWAIDECVETIEDGHRVYTITGRRSYLHEGVRGIFEK